jgi:hypothetical protein
VAVSGREGGPTTEFPEAVTRKKKKSPDSRTTARCRPHLTPGLHSSSSPSWQERKAGFILVSALFPVCFQKEPLPRPLGPYHYTDDNCPHARSNTLLSIKTHPRTFRGRCHISPRWRALGNLKQSSAPSAGVSHMDITFLRRGLS